MLQILFILLITITTACNNEEQATAFPASPSAKPTAQIILESTATLDQINSGVESTLTVVSPTAVPTFTATPPSTLDSLTLPEPLSGWVWHQSQGGRPFALMLPETWQPRTGDLFTFQSPKTGSLIFVERRPLPEGETDWWEWMRQNQQQALSTQSLPPEQIKPNATLQGKPAFFYLDEGLGSAQIVMAVPDENRLLSINFHSGVLPRLEAEMDIYRTVLETFVLSGVDGETKIPTGWETGTSLTIYPKPYTFQSENGDMSSVQELVGIVSNVEPGRSGGEGRFTLTENNGATHIILLKPFKKFFGGTMLDQGRLISTPDLLETGNRVQVVGVSTTSGNIVAQYIALEVDGAWRTGIYHAYFDLEEWPLNPVLLEYYLQDASLSVTLHSNWENLLPLLVKEDSTPITNQALSLTADQEVLARVRLKTVTPIRFELEKLFVLDGECFKLLNDGKQCFYWQEVYSNNQESE